MKKSPAALALLSAIAMSVSMSAFCPAQAADDNFNNTIQTTGQGRVKTLPDSLTVSFSVHTEAKTMAEARTQNAKVMNTVVGKIKTLAYPGLELETDNFSANPVYKYEKDGRSKITGYAVDNAMTARLEGMSNKEALEQAATKISDTALSAGATSANSIGFYLSDNNPVFDQALALAVKQARRKADVMADASSTRILGVHTLESYSSSTPMQTMSRAKAASAEMYADAAPEPESVIVAGPMQVEASVTARFDIAD